MGADRFDPVVECRVAPRGERCFDPPFSRVPDKGDTWSELRIPLPGFARKSDNAGFGALLLMEITGTQFTVIAFIGILLLIGIVKKNAILMVDFAIAAEREGRTPEEAIIEACRKRFRPILMTSCAAFFGAVPLLLQTGSNASFHRPLGIAICGGLVVSQVLTLYTTPVVYVYLDRFGSWAKRLWRRFFKGNGTAAAVTAGK